MLTYKNLFPKYALLESVCTFFSAPKDMVQHLGPNLIKLQQKLIGELNAKDVKELYELAKNDKQIALVILASPILREKFDYFNKFYWQQELSPHSNFPPCGISLKEICQTHPEAKKFLKENKESFKEYFPNGIDDLENDNSKVVNNPMLR